MNCILTHEFYIHLVKNICGVIITIAAIICILTNRTIDKSINRILQSFCVANIFGNCMSLYDTTKMICEGHQKIGFIGIITAMLSLSHILLLTLAEYITMTHRTSDQNAGNYNGLIFLSWMISIVGGSVDIVTISHPGKVIFALLSFSAICYVLMKYHVIIKLHNTQEKVQNMYEHNFLKGSFYRRKEGKHFWNVKYFSVIIFSYIVCCIPMLTLELIDGLYGHVDQIEQYYSYVLVVYSLNYYFLAVICIYLKYQERKVRKKKKDVPVTV